MDIQWIIEENMRALAEGASCGCAVTEAILTGLSMGELDKIKCYQKAKEAVILAMEEYPKECGILASMIDKIITNSQNHIASLQKAAAACAGQAGPTAVQYDEAVNEI